MILYLKQTVKWFRISAGIPETNGEVAEALTRITAGVPETNSEVVEALTGDSEDQ